MASDDVTAAAYNPAALASLRSAQVSLSYQSGIIDDAYGRVDAGIPGFGVAAGYYTAGDVDLLENGVSRTVNAQSDLMMSVGMARRFGATSIGIAGKFISSQLAETDRATAWAGDAGAVFQFRSLRLGAAVQNLGGKLTFVDDGDPLPRIARAGIEIPLRIVNLPAALRAEAPYLINDSEWRPAAGVEIRAGPMFFRAGYRTQSELEGVSLGTGFVLGGLSVDYAFGLVDDLDARQRVSVVFRFDPPERQPAGGIAIDEKRYQRRRDARDAATGKKKPARRRLGDIR